MPTPAESTRTIKSASISLGSCVSGRTLGRRHRSSQSPLRGVGRPAGPRKARSRFVNGLPQLPMGADSTGFIHNTLGLNTSQKSKQTERIAELERLLRNKGWLPGRAPQWETQLQHGRQAAFAALRAWNDPSSSFKTESFVLLLVTAWNSVCLAILQKKNDEWREVDEKGKPVIRGGRESSLGSTNL